MQIDELVQKHGKEPEKLLTVLMECQKNNGDNALSDDDIRAVAKAMELPVSRVCSVVEFYSLLSRKKRGKHIIQLCGDVPCYINGSVNLKESLEKELGIVFGETTGDGLFTLEFTSCLGYCEQSPAMRIDEDMYGRVTPEALPAILEKYRSL
ncbi:MAG: NAD(P)H-dependent oxidoreductase subunit E [Clostridiaceae bacterium]|nr:NAD(P)H-dependent oxidoreductase subunit E [Clostridiaceae bacterium]